MKDLKIQIEIKYYNILNFNIEYKEIINPYLKLANFKLENFGGPDEYIILSFEEEGVIIDLRWDRAILTCDVSRSETIFNPQSSVQHFIAILDKIRELKTFVSYRKLIIGKWIVLPTQIQDNQELHKHYLNKPIEIENMNFEDFSTVEEFTNDRDFVRIQSGIFKPEKDVKRFNIIDRENISKDYNGLLTYIVYVRDINNSPIKYSNISEVNREIQTIINKLK